MSSDRPAGPHSNTDNINAHLNPEWISDPDSAASELILRTPVAEDGYHVHRLVGQCPPLDPNSLYCNLLQCSHFSATSVAATLNDQLVGFVSGYCVPARPDTVFIWQVAVGEAARGRGLATQMIDFILSQPACRAVAYLETTITKENDASWALFRRVAELRGAEMNSGTLFDHYRHFHGEHESEILVRLGPFTR